MDPPKLGCIDPIVAFLLPCLNPKLTETIFQFSTHTQKKKPKLKDNLAKKRPEKVYEFKKMLM